MKNNTQQQNLYVFTIKQYSFYRISFLIGEFGTIFSTYIMSFNGDTILFIEVKIRRKKVKLNFFNQKEFDDEDLCEIKSLFEVLYINMVYEPWII
jgi:hypothetical protein